MPSRNTRPERGDSTTDQSPESQVKKQTLSDPRNKGFPGAFYVKSTFLEEINLSPLMKHLLAKLQSGPLGKDMKAQSPASWTLYCHEQEEWKASYKRPATLPASLLPDTHVAWYTTPVQALTPTASSETPFLATQSKITSCHRYFICQDTHCPSCPPSLCSTALDI